MFFPLLVLAEVHSASFKIVNKCRHTIWPGLLSGANAPQLPTTGFALKSGKSKTITIPKSWSGRMWGRTHCGRDSSGKLSCLTGDCGSGMLQCAGSGAKPPATLAEFTLNGTNGLDFYDVSLVDGYNLPMLVLPKGGTINLKKFIVANIYDIYFHFEWNIKIIILFKIIDNLIGTRGGCGATGCLVDLNGACPKELRVASGGRVVACRSACEALGDPRFCCSEAFATPDTCGPSMYSLFFKYICPRAYSYAYDDKTSTFTCASPDYMIVFCPSPYTR